MVTLSHRENKLNVKWQRCLHPGTHLECLEHDLDEFAHLRVVEASHPEELHAPGQRVKVLGQHVGLRLGLDGFEQLRADIGPHLLHVLRASDLGALQQAGQRLRGRRPDAVVEVELQHRDHQANLEYFLEGEGGSERK